MRDGESIGRCVMVCCFEGQRMDHIEVIKLGPMRETAFPQCGPSLVEGRERTLDILQENGGVWGSCP